MSERLLCPAMLRFTSASDGVSRRVRVYEVACTGFCLGGFDCRYSARGGGSRYAAAMEALSHAAIR